MPISADHKALLITQAAVGTDQNEKYVFVVNDQGKVERRAVELGAPRPGLQVIATGLATGDRVIIDGLQHVLRGCGRQRQDCADAGRGRFEPRRHREHRD